MGILFKNFPAEEIFKKADAARHGKGSFFFVVESKQDAGREEFEGLEKRSIRAVVINGVHLGDKNIRVVLHIREVIFIGASPEIPAVFPLFIKDSFLFWKPASHLPAQIQRADARGFMEDAVFDVVIE